MITLSKKSITTEAYLSVELSTTSNGVTSVILQLDTCYDTMQPELPTSVGQEDNFFTVSSRAATYSEDASFNVYIYIQATKNVQDILLYKTSFNTDNIDKVQLDSIRKLQYATNNRCIS